MPSRITIYGTGGDARTKSILKELNSLDLLYQFHDILKDPDAALGVKSLDEADAAFPKVEIARIGHEGAVYLSDPDIATLRQTFMRRTCSASRRTGFELHSFIQV